MRVSSLDVGQEVHKEGNVAEFLYEMWLSSSCRRCCCAGNRRRPRQSPFQKKIRFSANDLLGENASLDSPAFKALLSSKKSYLPLCQARPRAASSARSPVTAFRRRRQVPEGRVGQEGGGLWRQQNFWGFPWHLILQNRWRTVGE